MLSNGKHHSSCSTWPTTLSHFILSGFPGGGCCDSSPDLSIHSHRFRLFLRDPQTFSIQLGDIISPADSGSAPRSLSSGTCLIQLQKESTFGHAFKVPKSPNLALINSNEHWDYSEDYHHLIPRSKPTNPAVEPHFHHLYSQPYSFSHYPQLVSTGWW